MPQEASSRRAAGTRLGAPILPRSASPRFPSSLALAAVVVGAPRGVSITPDGRTAFVTLGGESSVAVVDLVGRKVVQRATVGASPDGVALAPRPAR